MSEDVNRSAEIRALLETEPQLTGPAVVRRLGERGVQVDANLVRVVRHNLRKVKAEADRRGDAYLVMKARQAKASLDSRLTQYCPPGLSESDFETVQISIDDLIALAHLIGGKVTSEQLHHAALGLWMARHGQLSVIPNWSHGGVDQQTDRVGPEHFQPPAATPPTVTLPAAQPERSSGDSSQRVQPEHLEFYSYGEERVQSHDRLELNSLDEAVGYQSDIENLGEEEPGDWND